MAPKVSKAKENKKSIKEEIILQETVVKQEDVENIKKVPRKRTTKQTDTVESDVKLLAKAAKVVKPKGKAAAIKRKHEVCGVVESPVVSAKKPFNDTYTVDANGDENTNGKVPVKRGAPKVKKDSHVEVIEKNIGVDNEHIPSDNIVEKTSKVRKVNQKSVNKAPVVKKPVKKADSDLAEEYSETVKVLAPNTDETESISQNKEIEEKPTTKLAPRKLRKKDEVVAFESEIKEKIDLKANGKPEMESDDIDDEKASNKKKTNPKATSKITRKRPIKDTKMPDIDDAVDKSLASEKISINEKKLSNASKPAAKQKREKIEHKIEAKSDITHNIKSEAAEVLTSETGKINKSRKAPAANKRVKKGNLGTDVNIDTGDAAIPDRPDDQNDNSEKPDASEKSPTRISSQTKMSDQEVATKKRGKKVAIVSNVTIKDDDADKIDATVTEPTTNVVQVVNVPKGKKQPAAKKMAPKKLGKKPATTETTSDLVLNVTTKDDDTDNAVPIVTESTINVVKGGKRGQKQPAAKVTATKKPGKKAAKPDDGEKEGENDEAPSASPTKIVERGSSSSKKESSEMPASRKRAIEPEEVPTVPKKKPAKEMQNKTATDFKSIDYACDKLSAEDKEWNFKISSWNVDGIRAWLSKGGLDYINHEKPDILCLQEIKCPQDKLPKELVSVPGYHPYWLCGDKDGFAGVCIYTKQLAIHIENGIGDEELDLEGRIITAEYELFYLVGTYVPNAGRKLVTLPKRLKWNEAFEKHVKALDEKKPVIICGDMNVAHEEIDLSNPKTNKNNPGFTPQEREGMSRLLGAGFVDTFRNLYPQQRDAYTFWTYMMNCRAKNVGWRLDYFIVSERLFPYVCDSVIRNQVYGSDHCPVTLYLHLKGWNKLQD